MIIVQISSLTKAIFHKCHLKATYWSAFLLGFSFLIICLVCCSCGSTKVVPLATIHTITKSDTLHINNVQYDSIYINHTSDIDRSRDTIKITETMTEYRYKFLRDTIERIKLEVRHDSIPYEVRITEVKEIKHIPPWIKPLAIIGLIAILLFVRNLKPFNL